MLRTAVLSFVFCGIILAQTRPQDTVLKQAVENHQNGNFSAAIDGYREFLKAHPDASAVRSNLGAALAHEGRFDEAVREYKIALEGQDNPAVRLNLALAYYKSGQLSPAAQELEKIRAVDAKNSQVTQLLATCYLRTGENKKVIDVMEPVAQDHPDDLAVAYLLGTAYIRDNQIDRGQVLLDRILRNGDSAEARLLMGTAKYMGNDMPGARADFARAAELNPKLPQVNAYLGIALLRGGDMAGAEKAFRHELEVDPNDFDANLQLAGILRQDERYDEARTLLDRALRLRPGDFGARYQIAAVDFAQGKVPQARTELESLVKDAPQFVEAHVTLATVYYREKRKEDGDREREIVKKLNAALQAKQPGVTPKAPPAAGATGETQAVPATASSAGEAKR